MVYNIIITYLISITIATLSFVFIHKCKPSKTIYTYTNFKPDTLGHFEENALMYGLSKRDIAMMNYHLNGNKNADASFIYDDIMSKK